MKSHKARWTNNLTAPEKVAPAVAFFLKLQLKQRKLKISGMFARSLSQGILGKKQGISN